MLPETLADRLRLPVVAAPMTGASGPELVAAACAAGVIGCLPTHNAPAGGLEAWLASIAGQVASGPHPAPLAANLVVHRTNPRLDADLAVVLASTVEVVVASVGSPGHVVAPLHEAGIAVWADVATLRHAERAAELGVDGLVVLAAGAGGQTGWLNPFAFVRAVRSFFDGVVVLAGGVSDGAGILAARVLGADLVHVGTRFLATRESRASEAYKQAVVAATLDEVTTSTQVSGLTANVLADWLARQPAAGDEGFRTDRLLTGDEVWAAGHSVSGTDDVPDVAQLVARLAAQYEDAQADLRGPSSHPLAGDPSTPSTTFARPPRLAAAPVPV